MTKTSSSSSHQKPVWRHPGVTVVRGERSPLSLKRSPARFLTSPTKSTSSSKVEEERHRSVSRDLDHDLASCCVVNSNDRKVKKRSVATQTTARPRRNRSQSLHMSRTTTSKRMQTKTLLSTTRDLLRNEISRQGKSGKALEALSDQLKWTESELKSARAHVMCLGESTRSWSNMSTGAVDLALRRAAQDALRSEAGVLVLKLNRRVHPLTRRREFVPRAIRVDTATSSPRLIYFSPSDALSGKKRRVFVLHAVRFGVLEDDHDRISRSLTFTLSEECCSTKERRHLDVVFGDVSTAINSFLAIQSLLDVDTEHRETREQLQWKIAQFQVSKMLGKKSKRSEKDNEIVELEPLFAYVQKAVCSAASSGCRDSYRSALARHRSAVHTLPLPSSNERIRRLVTPEQYRKDLTREPGVSINGVLFPMSSNKNYEIFLRELSSSLSKFEESHVQDVLRSVSRTFQFTLCITRKSSP